VKHVLKNTPPKKRIAAVNLSTSRSVDDIVNLLNGKLYRSPVGEINVIKKMKETGAVIGGEGSGGVILPEVHYGRDSLVGIALILSELAEFGRKVSAFKKQLPEYHILKEKFELKDTDLDKIISLVKEKYSSYPMNEEDGLRIDFESSWVNFRKSNTEPIMRIITEAHSKKEAGELQKEILSDISHL
jgi:phosphomannomutase